MGTQERRSREKQELRQRIQEAATELFVMDGYQNVSIRKIADRIEYAPSTIYLYFKDKEELIQSICNDMFAKLSEILLAIRQLDLAPNQKMAKCLRAYIEFGLAHPNHYVVTFCTPQLQYQHQQPNVDHDQIMNAGLQCFDLLRQGLQDALRAGTIRQINVEVTSQIVWAQIHGLTSLLVSMQTFPWQDREMLIQDMVDSILRSLAKN